MKVGAAFSDAIYTEKKSFLHKRTHYDERKELSMRFFLIPIFIALLSITLLGKLFFLQIIQGVYYRSLSDSNRLRRTIIHAPRGVIFDRNGDPLVYNTPGFRETINGKAQIIDQQQAMTMLAKDDKHLEVDSLRDYPYKDVLAHVVGYIGQISSNELALPQFTNYQATELIGKTGIEKEYESQLKGTDGQTLTEVDSSGKKIRTLGQTDPIPGSNITLTIDASLQQAAYTAMADVQKGAAIVSKPDGEVLAMVSKPSFDPNLFTHSEKYTAASTSAYTKVSQILLDNNSQPLLNRAIAGTYPPGSTFKLITAAAGLETGTIDSTYSINDTGILKVGDFSFANWYYTQYGKTEGTVDIIKAIKRSNDIFFYKLGEKLGVEKLSAIARSFGLGNILGIDLGGEEAGLVPTKAWKKKVIGEDWYLGDDYHYGIGQGYLLTTPLQVNAWTQAIANEGKLYQPRLLMNHELRIMSQGLLTTKNFDLIRQGMIEACSPGGVAWPLFQFKVKNAKLQVDGKNFLEPVEATGSANTSSDREVAIACKTGTAQHGGEQTLPHAWITLFAPAYNPQIVVTVLSESSGEGSNVAGPIAKKILEAYFEK